MPLLFALQYFLRKLWHSNDRLPIITRLVWIPARSLTFTHKSTKPCKQKLNLYRIERLWRNFNAWIASTVRAADADAPGLATTIGAKTCFNFLVRRLVNWLGCLHQPSLRENESDFMSRTFAKQSRHNVMPEAYKLLNITIFVGKSKASAGIQINLRNAQTLMITLYDFLKKYFETTKLQIQSHALATLLTFLLLLLSAPQSNAYQHNFVFVNKSYNKDLPLSLRLYKSFERFVQPTNIPFYIVVPNKELDLFKTTFLQAQADKKIARLPIFLSDEYVFKKCGPHVYQKAMQMTGWESQQVVKMCFGKLDIAKDYMTIDSEIYFTRPFQTNILFQNYNIKTYLPRLTGKKNHHCTFAKVKEVLKNKSQDDICFYTHFATWSSDLLYKLESFVGYDFADLIKIIPYEMQWYGDFVYTHHKDLFFPLQALFTIIENNDQTSPLKESNICLPSKGVPWTYGFSNYRKVLPYVNHCGPIRTFITALRQPKKYINWTFMKLLQNLKQN